MKKLLIWFTQTFIATIVIVLIGLISESKNTSCLDICLFPEGRGFPFAFLKLDELNSPYGHPFSFSILKTDIYFWFVIVTLYRLFKWMLTKLINKLRSFIK